MSKINILLIFLIIIVLVVFGGWLYFYISKPDEQSMVLPSTSVHASSSRSISAFSFQSLNPVVNGVVNEANHTIALTVPPGTNVASLVPTIQTSEGAIISPASDVAQNFNNSIVYTITAPDGEHQEYTVKVMVAAKPVKAIMAFMVPSQIGDALINQDDHTISVTVVADTNITNLVPTITLVPGSVINPAAALAQNFTQPVTYQVTTKDNIQQSYVVTVMVAPANTDQNNQNP